MEMKSKTSFEKTQRNLKSIYEIYKTQKHLQDSNFKRKKLSFYHCLYKMSSVDNANSRLKIPIK